MKKQTKDIIFIILIVTSTFLLGFYLGGVMKTVEAYEQDCKLSFTAGWENYDVFYNSQILDQVDTGFCVQLCEKGNYIVEVSK